MKVAKSILYTRGDRQPGNQAVDTNYEIGQNNNEFTRIFMKMSELDLSWSFNSSNVIAAE